MEQDIQLRCRCGRVQGVAQVSPSSGTHIVCYCDDCQAFAKYLQRTDVLDASGGTAIFQLAPARLRITKGDDALACLRLAPKGMLRWYAECCRTPLANTISGSVPFAGVLTANMDFESKTLAAESLLGPSQGVQGRLALGGVVPPNVHPTVPLGFVVRAFSRVFVWFLSGKGKPSPFFDAQGRPRANPTILSPEQRAALRPVATH